MSRINEGSPSGDRAVLGGEQETARCGNAVSPNREPGPAIEDRGGGRAARGGERHIGQDLVPPEGNTLLRVEHHECLANGIQGLATVASRPGCPVVLLQV